MATWPVSLPQEARLDDLVESTPELTIRTSMDTGPAKVRRRQTAAVRPFSIALDLTGDQVEDLDEFFITTLEGGALPFDWTHPRTNAAVEFRFVGGIRYKPMGPRDGGAEYWRATFDVELLP